MNKEEKELLVKVLCEMLPHKVRCKCVNGLGGGKTDKGVLKYIGNCNGVISNYYEDIPIDSGFVNNVFYPIENIKPYLRPMRSMTEEEQKEFVQFHCVTLCPVIIDEMLTLDNESDMFDWLNAHHFDYRNLIKKRLALVAPEDMYN